MKDAKKPTASDLITQRIAELDDWRGETLARMRKLIHDADPDVVEEWKWMGTPIFEHEGILCTGEHYKEYVKLTFARGALLPDPKGLFNAGLAGNARRAIDIRQGETVDAAAFKALVRAAVELNRERAALKPPKKAAKKAAKKTPAKKTPAKKTPAKKTPAKKTPAKKTAKR